MNRRPLRLLLASGAALVAAAALALACRANPSIDGADVPKIGSASAPPTCAAICDRLAALCGYAPAACVETCTAEADVGARVCRGQASSCREALNECTPAVDDGGASEPDAGDGG